MPEPPAAPFELGLWTGAGPFSEPMRAIGKKRLRREHRENLLGVFMPVGGDMHDAARGEPLGHEPGHRGLDEAALVVALLWPRVRKEHMDRGETRGSDHFAHHFDGVMLDHPYVGEPKLTDLPQQAADSGNVNLDRQVVALRIGGSDRRGRLAHARPDFHDQWGTAPENRRGIQQLPFVRHSEARHPFGIGALLRRGIAPLAQDITTNRGVRVVQGEGETQSAQDRPGLYGAGFIDKHPTGS